MTVKHGTQNQKKDAMNVWIESISRDQFEVCLRESRTFDGAHSNLVVVSHNFITNEGNSNDLSSDANQCTAICFNRPTS